MVRLLLFTTLVAVLLTGCPRRIDFGPWGPLDDPWYVISVVAERYGAVSGLVGEGRIAVDSPQGSGTLRMAVEVAQPAFVYLETVDLLGNPRGTFATDGDTFAFYDPGQNVFTTGPATAETLGRFLPVALPPEELVAAMLGQAPLLLQAEEARMQIDEEAGTYVVFLRAGNVRQRVEVGTRDLRLLSVETRGIPAIQAFLADHEPLVSGVPVPTTVVLHAPRTEVRLRYSRVRANQPVDPSVFSLRPPPGARLQTLER